MQHAGWQTPEVPGIVLESCHFHPGNPAQDAPHPRLLDGWLEVLIENTGSNPFYPRQERYAFVFIRHTSDGQPISVRGPEGVRYILLDEDTDIVTGSIKEDMLEVPCHGQVLGIWLDITLQTKNRIREMRTLITRMHTTPPV